VEKLFGLWRKRKEDEEVRDGKRAGTNGTKQERGGESAGKKRCSKEKKPRLPHPDPILPVSATQKARRLLGSRKSDKMCASHFIRTQRNTRKDAFLFFVVFLMMT